ncbi:outer membrane protein assembly factor BamC [Vibrio alfacsensis]|uniref:Outer membrane protein assembly factor BamC n=1 Tax=Vibrio alfacsensis TaxID=1074311 RepID=A0ABN5PE88_9VIBR|nr:outer membrane protein assembly factor BamC [Vibrio alfacsensis]AXY00562.1 outer membrane protein assembly factor BamC [Vibrio alfacsensis]WQE75499.1 outer membrane protein assembly factor BamC [Vibrio alfacsensis]BBM64073.1 outer membrane protein assembly factor BamC [Vibrio alfacsensis]BCN24780.1 outer membrane protein assembly factor BamC [Vibrio alfacsensis]
MKLSSQLVLSSLAVFVLTACSGAANQRRQAKDDFEYLNTPALEEWNVPADAQRQYYPNYTIPQGSYTGGIGKQVDIRPPQQVLELIPGARLDRTSDGEIMLWLLRKDELDKVWQTVQDMVANNKIPVENQTDSRIETGWVTWNSPDEDVEIGSRYEITRTEANGRHGFKVNLIDWREGNQVTEVTRTNRERYNVFMTNLVTARYDQQVREEAERKAQELVKHIPITMGKDRSGLPVIIARTPYNTLWQRVPNILPKMGFKIEERSQSQGTVSAVYASPDDEFWNDIGVKPIDLGPGKYTFLLGDLGNRTSINITDSSGKPVEEEFLKSLEPVLAAVVKE